MSTSESSLTTPSDRDLTNKWRPDTLRDPLTVEETKLAVNELYQTAFTDKFPRVDRTFCDPVIPMQNMALFSFVPSKNAKPDENGIFGFAKIRGVFASELESRQKAQDLIRNVDSYHSIYTVYMFRPFPVTVNSDYSAETDEVDIRKQTVETISSSIKQKKENEQREIKEIKEREERLLAESKQESTDPYEEYITLRVKKAQLSFTYLEHLKKTEEIKNIIIKTRKEVEEMDAENPTFKDTYYQKYMDARREAGIKEEPKESQDNFIKFLVEEAVLPGIDNVPSESVLSEIA